MAKKDMMTCTTECGPKCIVLGVVGALVAALGLWLVVGGLQMQWAGAPWTSPVLWYTGGLVLWCVAKCVKMKACPACR